MDEPITCTSELEELALALELEVELLVALQLEQALKLIRFSFTAGDFGASSRAEALDGAETFAVVAQRRTSRPPWQTQLTKSARFWTRRRRHGVDEGTGVRYRLSLATAGKVRGHL
jgi:hypothetical protein